VVAVLGNSVAIGKNTEMPNLLGTILLWLLCGVGWFYFLTIIRLRQAWYDSTLAMNQIKEFYIRHADGVDPNVLRQAFRWQPGRVPPPAKAWTVYFYSAMLIGFLDSAAYVAGSILILIDLHATTSVSWWPGMLVITMGLLLFAFHVKLYFAFLTLRSPKKLVDPIPNAEPARDLKVHPTNSAS
jgi:hypothetical protein